MTGRQRPWGRAMVTLVACVALIAGCGTRVRHADDGATGLNAAAGQGAVPEATAPPADGGTESGTPAAAALPEGGAAGAVAAGTPTTQRPVAGAGGVTTTTLARPGSGGQPSASPPAAGQPRPGGATAPTSPTGGTPGGGSAAGGPKSPVIVASIGNYGGVPGSTSLPVVQTAQVWVKAVNARGGLNGHEVRILVYDDGADPARHRSQMQDAIERKGAIALFANAEPLTGQCCVDYLNAKRVPVIGTSTNEQWAYESPMYFTQGSTGRAAGFAALASAAQQFLPEGKKKLGTMVCVEAQQCAESEKLFADNAASLGLQVVYQGRVSLGQPDFTAQCLAARNAGVEILAPIIDFPSVQRVAASCARQGFRPAWTHVPSGMADRYKDDPNLAGMRGASNFFPYFQDNTPATAEYQQAMKIYGGGIAKSVLSATGWTAGKLLEKAGAALPEPPTSAALLAGLWSIKDDTLGGLTQPLTFVKDQTAKPVSCWFNIAIDKGAWISPDGFKLQCRPTP